MYEFLRMRGLATFEHSKEQLETALRKGWRAVWKLPQRTHGYLLSLIRHGLPVFEEICRRSISFMRSCILRKWQVVRFVAAHGILFVSSSSCPRHNVLFCVSRFGCTAYILDGSVNDIVRLFIRNLYDGQQQRAANFL
jgi:hypothetical protein